MRNRINILDRVKIQVPSIWSLPPLQLEWSFKALRCAVRICEIISVSTKLNNSSFSVRYGDYTVNKSTRIDAKRKVAV